VDAGAIDRLANPVDVRRLIELHVDQGAAAKVDPQLDAMPEKYRQDPRNTEDQRKGEEVPLFPQPINVNATKQFHLKIRLTRTQPLPDGKCLSALLTPENRIEDVA
jgi:hypothetical protein